MYTLQEIYLFIARLGQNSPELKEYYNKSYDSLKEMIKRSNLISFIIIVLIAVYIFRDYINENGILSFKFNSQLILICSPLLISYFSLEWCLTARRRRELQKILKHIGFFTFNIQREILDWETLHFGLHSRDVLPFSFLIELRNISFTNRLNATLVQGSAILMLVLMPCFIAYTLLSSIFTIKFTLPILTCDLLTLYCLIHIVLFYANEVSELIRIDRDDRRFVADVEAQNRQQAPLGEIVRGK